VSEGGIVRESNRRFPQLLRLAFERRAFAEGNRLRALATDDPVLRKVYDALAVAYADPARSRVSYSPPPAADRRCPHCATPMRFLFVGPHQRFGNLDARRFLCACGETFIDVVARSD
jgi:hypothetical protein